MAWFRFAISRARKFAVVDRQSKALVLHAIALLWLVRIALWIAPFRIVQSLMRRLGNSKTAAAPRFGAGQISELVTRCAQYVPRANCLPQALTIDVLLRREGYDPTLKIGVARGAQGEFQAHAWVEVGDQTLSTTEQSIGRFTALPAAFG